MSVIDRRRFIYGAAAGGLGLGATASATFAATDDELAFANFCLAGEFLLKDFLRQSRRRRPLRR
jgi:hypothetical protein